MLYAIIIIVVVIAVVLFVRFSSGKGDGSPHDRLENDALRFAGLLISEIKLYNEGKILKGLENNNLYEALQTEIEEARKMYQKRIGNDRYYDYFDDELVRILADGDRNKLGAGFNK